MSIVTHPANDAYRDGWDATFGKKEEKPMQDGWVCVLCLDGSNRPGQRLAGEHTKRVTPDFPHGEMCINDPKRNVP